MIIVIDGAAGSGKTFLGSRIAFKDWLSGENVAANCNIHFKKYAPQNAITGKIRRWFRLDEVYDMDDCVLFIDDAQILFDALTKMPAIFREKIAAHRHQGIKIITTTQDFLHIHWRMRSNVHLRYSCRSLFRFPMNEKKKPIFQVCAYTKKQRKPDHDERNILWRKEKRFLNFPRLLFISKFWTRSLYDTYSSLDLDKFLCKIIAERKPGQKKNQYRVKFYSRNLVASGKARL